MAGISPNNFIAQQLYSPQNTLTQGPHERPLSPCYCRSCLLPLPKGRNHTKDLRSNRLRRGYSRNNRSRNDGFRFGSPRRDNSRFGSPRRDNSRFGLRRGNSLFGRPWFGGPRRDGSQSGGLRRKGPTDDRAITIDGLCSVPQFGYPCRCWFRPHRSHPRRSGFSGSMQKTSTFAGIEIPNRSITRSGRCFL